LHITQIFDTVKVMKNGPTPTGLRERKKLATRQALAQAALRLTARHGLEKVRVEEIAATAGVSLRTFNNYFSSKEEAIVSIAVDRAWRIGAALGERPADESLAEALSRVFVEQYIGGDVPDRKKVAQIHRAIAAPGLLGEYLKAMTRCQHSLAEAIARRTGHDATRDLYPRVLAAAVLAAARTAIEYWRDSKERIGLGAVLRRAIRQVVTGGTEVKHAS
jgi:AcrR family transcriptional regulator